jgi:hypothetical protein
VSLENVRKHLDSKAFGLKSRHAVCILCLALMSSKYIGLGLLLLQTFIDAVNENELNKNGNETLKKAVASAKETN